MNIRADYNIADLSRYAKEQINEYYTHVIQSYKDAANVWMERAKLKTKAQGSFGNRTFNLRSSIGYIMLMDGREIAIEFETVGPGDTGTAKGMEYARGLAGGYQDGLVLICVAGMEYAAAVESKGFDVITGSSLYIENDLAQLLAA